MFADERRVFFDIWQHHFAMRNLIMKDFRIRYRNMSLGVLWSVLNPLVMLGILVLVFTFIYPQKGHVFFPISILLGIVSYNLVALCVPAATSSIVDNAPLVKKVIFPRQILPISVVLSQAIQAVTQLALVAVFLLIFQVPITLTFLWVPVIYGVLLLFVLGVGLMCSAFNVIFRDMRYLVDSILTVLFWLSPVFYTLPIVQENLPNWVFDIYILNPMAGCIDAMRRVVLEGSTPDFQSFLTAVLVSLVALVTGLFVFSRLQRKFADLV